MKNTKQIILDIAEIKTQEIEKELKFNQISGYSLGLNFYDHLIGLELIKNEIKFESNYDIGSADSFKDKKKMSREEKSFAKQYIEMCRQTPSRQFLEQYLSIDEQRSFLLRAWGKIDMEKVLKAESFTVVSSVSNIIRNFRDIGIKCSYISPEIDASFSQIMLKKINMPYMHSNYFRCFLFEGICFKNETLELFQSRQKALGYTDNKDYLSLVEINEKNHIKNNYHTLDMTLVEKNTKTKSKKI